MKIINQQISYAVIIIIAVVVLLIITFKIPKIQQDLQLNIREDMVRTVSSILDNLEDEYIYIASIHPGSDLSDILKSNPHLRHELETQLSLITAEDIKYTYVLFRDKQGKYRFLLDGAIVDKADFGMKFDIEDKAWDTAYTTQQPQLIEQKKLAQLWITYLKPIVINNKVQGIIVADFSAEGHEHIIDIIKPLQKYLWIFLGLILLGSIISIIQYVLYRLSQKRVYIDPLTGIYNRNFFNDIINSIDYEKYAIAMIDLDKFKVINDTYGHDIGDDILRSVANALKSSIREYDKLVRYGGEEFLLFISMRDVDRGEVNKIMERLKQNVASIVLQTGLIAIRPTVSIGLNTFTSHFKSEHDAIAMADKMLYEAKRTGRNKIVNYTPSKSVGENSIQFLNVHHVKEALEEKRLFCEYQPIVQLDTNNIIGYEALVRIRDREGKTLYPCMFLPNIAHSNIYKELTLELLRINFLKVHETHICLSINLNITDILDEDIYQNILNHLGSAEKESHNVTFELLEEEQITNLELLQERIIAIRTIGAKISIDDFGSGYSNFSHIFALDVDIIKIDGSLIKDIDTSEISRKLVESIVAFSHASNKRVVAEFIHSESVLQIVKELNIAYGQGFYLGKPSEAVMTTITHT